MTVFDYHHIAKVNIARCVKEIRAWKKFSDWKTDALIINMLRLATQELKFFFKHRYDLATCPTNGFGKWICNDIEL